jgi:hypothetical protein
MSSFPIFSLAILCYLAGTQFLDSDSAHLVEKKGKTCAIPSRSAFQN